MSAFYSENKKGDRTLFISKNCSWPFLHIFSRQKLKNLPKGPRNTRIVILVLKRLNIKHNVYFAASDLIAAQIDHKKHIFNNQNKHFV